MTLDEVFRALCIRVADEKDPKKLELLKQRLRLLLQESPDPLEETHPVVQSLPS